LQLLPVTRRFISVFSVAGKDLTPSTLRSFVLSVLRLFEGAENTLIWYWSRHQAALFD
jgi:hypothetical protein